MLSMLILLVNNNQLNSNVHIKNFNIKMKKYFCIQFNYFGPLWAGGQTLTEKHLTEKIGPMFENLGPFSSVLFQFDF
jgi:hypothetical protein